MVAPDGYYEQSYPPSLWAPAAPVTAARTGAGDASRTAAGSPAPDGRPAPDGPDPAGAAGRGDAAPLPPGLTATAGQPGLYTPAVRAADRPRNMGELREQVIPDGSAPWPAGDYLLIGESGKRAHWSGTEWLAGESPGYGGPALP